MSANRFANAGLFWHNRAQAMSERHQNQHYVSRVLLKRFTDAGHLQRFNMQEKKWRRISPKKVFSGLGYTQLMAYGATDNSVEESFQKVETALPETLKVLDEAAKQSGSTTIDKARYENLCWYCAYLWRNSPFAKAVAAFEFVYQLIIILTWTKAESNYCKQLV